jgi:hypothetical protein
VVLHLAVESEDAMKKESTMCIRATPQGKTLLIHATTVYKMSMFFESISGPFLQKVLTSGSQRWGAPLEKGREQAIRQSRQEREGR